jgi:ribosomal protein S18 acetylase RimI-like enzyme
MSSLEAAATSRLSFRDAGEADLPEILALLADDPLGKYREMALSQDAEIPDAYRGAFDAILTDPRNRLIVAERDKQVAACLQLTFIPGLTYMGGERAQIEAVRVARSLRGGGVGKALIRYGIDLAHQRGCVLVQLTTDKRRAEAIEFYRALGFTDSHIGMKLAL